MILKSLNTKIFVDFLACLQPSCFQLSWTAWQRKTFWPKTASVFWRDMWPMCWRMAGKNLMCLLLILLGLNEKYWSKGVCLFRRVVIILEIEVVKPAGEVGGKLGDPVPYNEGNALKFVWNDCVVQNYDWLRSFKSFSQLRKESPNRLRLRKTGLHCSLKIKWKLVSRSFSYNRNCH